MKLIFLDIDGVIVLPVPGRKTLLPSHRCIDLLNQITEATGAKIVLSSGRRYVPDLERTLVEWGVRAPIVGMTPVIGDGLGGRRVEEIHQWLATCAEPIEGFVVILDDDPIEDAPREHVVRTNWATGLTESEADEAISRLVETPSRSRQSFG